MRDSGRLVLTAVIWGGLLVLTGTLLTSPVGAIAQANSATVLGVVLVLGTVAAVMTLAIWLGGADRAAARADNSAYGKRKRLERTRMHQLLENLSDDEVYELEALLLGHQAQPDTPLARRDADA